MSTNEQLAQEAAEWADGTRTLQGWKDAPEAVPEPSTAISIRIPNTMLGILKEFARRRGIRYQRLMKVWLRDRIAQEAKPILQSPAWDRKALEQQFLEDKPQVDFSSHPRTSPVFYEAGGQEDRGA